MVILSNLSIIIPTYNRQDMALRSMRYWSGSPVSVYLFDGSELPIDDELNGLASNIHYHHVPVSLYERLRYAVRFVKTEFCALLADDDFFLPSGLEKAIKQMEQNPDLVSCGGQAVGFFLSGPSVLAKSVYSAFLGYSINQSDPSSRMLSHMATYTPSTIYSVTRSEVWKSAMRIMLYREFPVFAIGELQFEMAITFLGKSEMHDRIHWLRCFDNQPIRGTDISLDPRNRFDDFWDSPMRQNEKSDFLNMMAKELVKFDKGDFNSIRAAVETSFNAYREFTRKRKDKGNRLNYWQKLQRRIESLFNSNGSKKKPVEMTLNEFIQLNYPTVAHSAKADIEEISSYLEAWNRSVLRESNV